MKRGIAGTCLALLLGAGLWVVMDHGAGGVTRIPHDAGPSALPEALPPLSPGERVAFLELGSVGCRPCEAMKPVMNAVRRRYPEQVDVVFHDVKKNPSLARRYGVRLIPTQVFLGPDGSEFFRHEGFYSEGDVVVVLKRMGVR